MVDLNELKRLEAAATPGPWRQDPTYPDTFTWGPHGEMVADHDANGEMRTRGVGGNLPIAINAALVVALRNAAPAIIAEIEELRRDKAILALRLAMVFAAIDAAMPQPAPEVKP